jgi:hypothetical protein
MAIINIEIDDETHKMFKIKCVEENITMQSALRGFILDTVVAVSNKIGSESDVRE